MSMLQIRDFPPELHAKLAERAKAQHTTMSAYATRVLERDLDQMTLDEWFTRLEQVIPSTGPGGRGIDSAQVVNEARDEAEDYLMQGILGEQAQPA